MDITTKGQDTEKRVTIGEVDTVEDVERNHESKGGDVEIPEIAEQPKRGWRSYIWDSLDKSPEERKLIFKLDWALLTIGCLCESPKEHPPSIIPGLTVCVSVFCQVP